MRRVVVGFSGGVTSAWCAGWALKNFPREEVVLLFHDTQDEDEDTYRFLREMAAALKLPITDRSDGRSVNELARDEGMIPSNLAPFCSRILKQEPGQKYIYELQQEGVTEIIRLFGFSANEPDRIQRQTAIGWQMKTFWCDVVTRFPVAETGTSKQACADWCSCEMGVVPSAMYEHFDHANCKGCHRGKKTYWLAVDEHYPEVYEGKIALEAEMGYTIIPGTSLVQLRAEGMKRPAGRKESIEIGPCECGS